MVGFLERLFGRDGDKSGSGKMAKDRLQFVLVQDRIKLPADKLQAMKQEMLEVISKYVSVDIDNVDFNLSTHDRNGLLVAEIPFLSIMEEDEGTESADLTAAATPHPSADAVSGTETTVDSEPTASTLDLIADDETDIETELVQPVDDVADEDKKDD